MSSWSMLDLLLHGFPFEVLPDDRPKVEAAARRYSKDPYVSKAHRDHIKRIWLPIEDAAESEPLGFVFPEGGP